MNRFFALLIGLGLLGGGFYTAKQQLELQHRGAIVAGVVVDASTVNEISVGSRHGFDRSSQHSGVIEFTPEGGVKPLRFSASFWTRQTIGEAVRVRYDRGEPGNAQVAGWDNWLLPGVLAFIGVMCLLYVLGLVSGDGIEDTEQRWTLFRWFD